MLLNNALLLLLLALAVAAGWTLGRNGLRMDLAGRAQLPSQYYRGFNFLLDGEEEDAVDAFTEALAVNERPLILTLPWAASCANAAKWIERSEFIRTYSRDRS